MIRRRRMWLKWYEPFLYLRYIKSIV